VSEENPAWKQIVDLFKAHGLAEPPTRLRDELVVHLVAYREQRKSGYGPFDGYAVLNTQRKGVVLDDMAFVWDDQVEAEEHIREGEADEVRRVRVTIIQ
jgi:hypothetical protein